MWKTAEGKYLNELYQQIAYEANESEEAETPVDGEEVPAYAAP
jgi:hypothetical protein